MTTVLHIFDAHALDKTIEHEDETTMEVTYDEEDASDDDEFRSRWRPKRSSSDKTYLERRYMAIHLFGSTAEGEPVRLQVNGFQPFFFLRLPNDKRQTYEDCRRRLLDAFEQLGVEAEKEVVPASCVEFSFVKKRVLYGYTGGREYPFLQMKFQSLHIFRAVRKVVLDDTMKPIFQIYSGEDPLEVYDANLDPMLRFFHLRKLQPCGWVRAAVDLESHPAGGLIGECEWTDISPETAPPKASAPFLLAAWDIECYSADGEFPLPTRAEKKKKFTPSNNLADGWTATQDDRGKWIYTHPEQGRSTVKPCRFSEDGDPVIQIGVVLVQQDKPTERHIFVIGGSGKTTKDVCDDIEGIVVHRYKSEASMLRDWAAWMQLRNPDILVGYNTFGFDERYLWKRATELHVVETDEFMSLSRLNDIGRPAKLEEKFLSSGALGDNFLYLWSTYGRLQVDLYHYVKRSASLPSYKLDEVAKYYMSGKVSGLTKNDGQWVIKTKSTGDARPGRSLCLLDETGESLIEKVPVLEVEPGKSITIAAPGDADEVDTSEAVKWAIVKDDVPPAEIFRLHREGGPAGRAKVAKYCVQDCDLVVELYKKLDVFNNAMSMANVCSVPVSYIFTRGQGVKIESLIFKDCYERNMVIRTLDAPARNFNAKPGEAGTGAAPEAPQESYEGAIVLDPTPGFYMKSPIGVCDFASLYPSTIISENISYDSLLWVKDFDLNGKLISMKGSEADAKLAPPGTAWTDIEFDIWGTKEGDTRKHPEKVKKGVRICRYAQPSDGTKHTLPDIVAKLLAARKAKREEAKKETDPFRLALLDAEQLAYKLTANSLYGQLGSSTFKIRLQNLAASVTAYGRKQILFAKAAIEKFYGPDAGDPRCAAEIVYGDTDSLFVNFNVKDPATGEPLEAREAIVKTIEMTEEAGHLVTQCLKNPHDFEFDKVYYPFIIFSKKRYVGNKYEENPDDFKQTSMGIVLKRRDNAPILKTIYGGAIKILLNERNLEKAVNFVKDKCLELVDGKTSLSQLTITKSLSASYKTPTPPAHKVLADRIAARDPGNAPAAGERLGFVYVSPPAGQAPPKLQGDRIETPAYIREKKLKPDVRFYIEHQLMNPLSQLFALRVEEIPGYVPPTGNVTMIRPTTGGGEEGDSDNEAVVYAGEQAKLVSMRESIACELLFREALSRCDNIAVRHFATQMLGASVQQKSTSEKKTTQLVTPKSGGAVAKVAKQTTLTGFVRQVAPSTDNYDATKLIVESIQKQKREKAAAAAAAAEAPKKKKRATKAVVVPGFALEA